MDPWVYIRFRTNTNVTNTSYAMTGLTPSTDYDVYVQAVCSPTDELLVGP